MAGVSGLMGFEPGPSSVQTAATAYSPDLGRGTRSIWTVQFEVRLPEAGPQVRVHPSLYDRIAELLRDKAPVITTGSTSIGVSFEIESMTLAAAQEAALTLIGQVLRLLSLGPETLVGFQVLDRGATMADPTSEEFPECVGVFEAAELLRVSKQRVNQLAQRPDFPQPVSRLRATPVWRKSDVALYHESRVRNATCPTGTTSRRQG